MSCMILVMSADDTEGLIVIETVVEETFSVKHAEVLRCKFKVGLWKEAQDSMTFVLRV